MAGSESKTHSFDVDRQKLGSIYAVALLRAAEKAGRADEAVGEYSEFVDQVLSRHPQFEEALASPRVSVEDKQGMLDRVLGGRVSNELLTFLKVVAQHGRLDCLREIKSAARDELNRIRNRATAVVTTAEAMSPDLAAQVADRVRQMIGTEVEIEQRVDPAVIGGLVVRVGDTVYDGSVATKFSNLRREALSKTIQQLREAADKFVSGS